MAAESPRGRILVIGGGIVGLSLTTALRRAGFDAELFERASQWRDVLTGALLNIQINGMRALQLLGLFEQVQPSVRGVEEQRWFTWDGRDLGVYASATLSASLGAPDGLITRTELLRALIGALDAGSARMGSELVAIADEPDGVSATFADGHVERGDLLIGADGLHSVVRRWLLGPHEPRVAGHAFTRGYTLSPYVQGPRDRTQIYIGFGSWFGMYPMPRGRVSWFSIAKENPHTHGDVKEALLERHRGWDDVVVGALHATEASAIQTVVVQDHHPVHRWGRGRVTLAGDAAHAMPNTLGQGASQGLEDAAVLTACLARMGAVEGALRAYEARRIPRAIEVQARSQRLADVYVSNEAMRAYHADQALSDKMNAELGAEYASDMAFDFIGDA